MIIEYTEAEQKKIQDIIGNYQPDRDRLAKAYNALLDELEKEDERHKLLAQQQALMDSLQSEISTYIDKLQKERFKPIQEAGTEAIIANAKDQIPLILKQIHDDALRNYKNINSKALKELQLATRKNGELFVNTNFAIIYLKDELRLHLNALQNDKSALQDLLEIITEAVENSPLTDNEKILAKTDKAINMLQILQTPLHNYSMSIDPVNQQFFGAIILPRKDYVNGQEIFYFSDNDEVVYTSEKEDQAKDELNNLVSYSFWFNESLLEAAGIKQDINYFDFYVMQTLYNLKKAGNKQTSATAVAKILGYGDKPAKTQIEKIRASITKCNNTTIRLNNIGYSYAEGLDYYMETDYKLLPYRIINQKAISNGKILESYIRLDETTETPILLRMAEASGFVTTIPLKILDNDLTKNPDYYGVLYYTLMRISKAHYQHYKSVKISYKTLYKETQAGNDKNKCKSRKKVLFELLDHIMACNWWVTKVEDQKAAGTKEAGVEITLCYNEEAIETKKTPVKKSPTKKTTKNKKK